MPVPVGGARFLATAHRCERGAHMCRRPRCRDRAPLVAQLLEITPLFRMLMSLLLLLVVVQCRARVVTRTAWCATLHRGNQRPHVLYCSVLR